MFNDLTKEELISLRHLVDSYDDKTILANLKMLRKEHKSLLKKVEKEMK